MDDIHLVGRSGHGAQPLQQLSAIRMGGGRLQLHHFGVHRNVLTMDAHTPCAAGQGGTTGSRGLEAGQDDHVAVVACVVGQMVKDASTGGHAAG